MQQLPHQRSPLARFLALVVGAVVFAVSLLVGAAVFFALLGLAITAFAIFYLRLRWRLRKARRRSGGGQPAGQIIEGEYVVERYEHSERLRR